MGSQTSLKTFQRGGGGVANPTTHPQELKSKHNFLPWRGGPFSGVGLVRKESSGTRGNIFNEYEKMKSSLYRI